VSCDVAKSAVAVAPSIHALQAMAGQHVHLHLQLGSNLELSHQITRSSHSINLELSEMRTLL
jgi:hypothetical protein